MIRRRPCVLLSTLWLQTALAAPAQYSYRVVRVYPHDRDAFTQGLEFRGGYLYEGTGLNGHSRLRKVQLESGRVLQEIPLPGAYFGEGITVLDQRIVQLTWQSHKGFVYDQNSFRLLRSFDYPGEGWGLTNDGRQIYMSDGTSAIRCWDGVTLAEKRRFTVHDGAQPVAMLNELEFVKGELYANVWQTDKLVRFSPEDGRVTAWVDLSGLLNFIERATADVLNGIAYDAPGDRFFVTGKHWPKLFEIKLEPKR